MTGSTIDLAALAAVALAAVLGASSGALRQLVQLVAVVAGALAARQLAAPIAEGLGRFLSTPVARVVAPTFVFLGISALVSLVGGALLRGTAASRALRGPADRGLGALLGGVKGAAVAWVLLSILAVAGRLAPDGLARGLRSSQLVDLAGRYDLLGRVAPDGAKALERFRTRGEGEPARR